MNWGNVFEPESVGVGQVRIPLGTMLDLRFVSHARLFTEIEVGVFLDPLFIRFGIGDDCGHGTSRRARITIDTLLRINIENVGSLVEAFYRADLGAVSILAVKTGLLNYVGH
jgi:hypothetical protein